MSIFYPVSVIKKPDASLSGTSENSVQNKVVTAALNAKQDTLTFDTEPIENSTNPVTSGGLYAILAEKQDAPTTFTGTIVAGSTTITFTNDVFARDVIVTSILTDNMNTIIYGVEQDTTNRSLTVTISPMDVNVDVMVSIAVNDSPTPTTMQSNVDLSALGQVLDQTGTNYIFESNTPPEPGQDVYVVSG